MTIVLSLVYLRLPFEMVERNVTVEKNQIKMLNVLFPHPWPKNSSLAPGRGQKVFLLSNASEADWYKLGKECGFCQKGGVLRFGLICFAQFIVIHVL